MFGEDNNRAPILDLSLHRRGRGSSNEETRKGAKQSRGGDIKLGLEFVKMLIAALVSASMGPFGVWLAHRRDAAGLKAWRPTWPKIDLNETVQREQAAWREEQQRLAQERGIGGRASGIVAVVDAELVDDPVEVARVYEALLQRVGRMRVWL